MEVQPIGKAIVNSVIVSGSVAAGTVFFCTLAGFAFAKLRFRGRDALFAVTIGTLMIPPTLGVVPLYQVMSDLGLTGRLPSVVLPSLVTAFGCSSCGSTWCRACRTSCWKPRGSTAPAPPARS
jgi:cellobiose transport system permease protein